MKIKTKRNMGPVTKRRKIRHLWKNTDGAMAVEFAIILPVFVLSLFGTMELGNLLYAKSTLQHGIETAGRYAMVHTDATITEIKAEAVSRSMELGALSPTFTITQSTIDGIPFSLITVAGEYTMMTPLFSGETINITSQISVPQSVPEDFH